MTGDRLVNVRRYAKPFGKSCRHCPRRATVRADRVTRFGVRFTDVPYCAEHFAEAEGRAAA